MGGVHQGHCDADDLADFDDRAAADRDRRAEDRDTRARLREKRSGGIDERAENARRAAARDRASATADRARAATDRVTARSERRAFEKIRRYSTVDALTGLLRRDAGLPELHRMHHRAQRSGAAMVVAFVDVDGLKHVNDTHGHRAGDVMLRAVATALVASVRCDDDIVMRYGGDEFLIGTYGLNIIELTSRLTRIAIELSGQGGIGISFGTAQGQDRLGAVIDRADAALYATRRRRRSAGK